MKILNIKKLKGMATFEIVLLVIIATFCLCSISIGSHSYYKADKLGSESHSIFQDHFERAESKVATSQDPYVTKALVDVLYDCALENNTMGVVLANRDETPKAFVENVEKSCSSTTINKIALSQGGKYASVIASEIQRLGYPVEKVTSNHMASTVSLSDVNLASITMKTNQQSL